MRTDPRKVRQLLEEYASLIPLGGNVPRQDRALMRDLETELLKLGCLVDFDLDLLVSIWTCSSRSFQNVHSPPLDVNPSASRWNFSQRRSMRSFAS